MTTYLDALRRDGLIRPATDHTPQAARREEYPSAWGTKPMQRCMEDNCEGIAFRSGRCKMHYDAHQRKLVRARKARKKAG